MQQVVTEKQARQITKGRLPHMPVVYEEGIRALQACIDLDDAKEWSDKADALAAWARMYHSDDFKRKAAQLKLRAYQRMGTLAMELRPQKKPGYGGAVPGPRSLLLESGLNLPQARAALTIARAPKDKVQEQFDKDRPPAPSRASLYISGRGSAAQVRAREVLWQARSSLCCVSAVEVALFFKRDEKVLQLVHDLQQWLDELEFHLKRRRVSEVDAVDGQGT